VNDGNHRREMHGVSGRRRSAADHVAAAAAAASPGRDSLSRRQTGRPTDYRQPTSLPLSATAVNTGRLAAAFA